MWLLKPSEAFDGLSIRSNTFECERVPQLAGDHPRADRPIKCHLVEMKSKANKKKKLRIPIRSVWYMVGLVVHPATGTKKRKSKKKKDRKKKEN